MLTTLSRRRFIECAALAAGGTTLGCGAAPPPPTHPDGRSEPEVGGPSPSKRSPSPLLSLPPRRPDAPGGKAFIASIMAHKAAAREAATLEAVQRGNVPDFLRQLAPIAITLKVGANKYIGEIFVTRDFVAIGSDDDFVRMPMGARTAQAIADASDCMLPTRHIVDLIYEHADVRVTSPRIQDPNARTTTQQFYQHHLVIEERLPKPHDRSLLVAGPKKTIVISRRIAERPGHLIIYGWFLGDGSAIQSLSAVHADQYVDYASGVRLVHKDMVVDGISRPIADVLTDRVLWPMISDEGIVETPRYRL